MKLLCFMAMLLYANAVAVPVNHLNLTEHQNNHSNHSNNQSVNHPPQPLQSHQRHLLLTRSNIPNSQHTTRASSVTRHTSSNKVEDYAKKLREDLDKQEKVLTTYIVTIRARHEKVKLKLSGVNNILKGLKEEIANATNVANKYQAEQRSVQHDADQLSGEYNKSFKMYQDEQENIKFEKQFLDEILRYIKLRKTQKLKC